MLDETLIVWAGEFGRTPMSQGGDGRDHHNAGFSMWLAGGGVKPGLVYGATDELGYTPSKIPPMSTTCTPPCCGSSGSSTRNSR